MAGYPTTQLEIAKPAGTVDDETLLIACIAIGWLPRPLLAFSTPDPCPGATPVIVPPAGWTTVLADFPGGEDNLGVGVVPPGTGPECDRMAVFAKIASAADPATFVFDWSAAGGQAGGVGFIKAFNPGTPGVPPTVDVAAPAVTISAAAGNPFDVDAPSVTPVQTFSTLMCLFVSRCSGFGSIPFSVPAGMSLATPDIANGAPGNLPTASAVPIALGTFVEARITNAPTGVRTSSCGVTTGYETAFQGMGYSLAIAGC